MPIAGTVRRGAHSLQSALAEITHPMTLTDHNGDLSLDGADRFTEIRCPVCGSPAFIYPRVLNDDKPVICAGCGAFVSTYGEMKRRSEED
jgi:hypothetical protein